jgi:hypothetical protein
MGRLRSKSAAVGMVLGTVALVVVAGCSSAASSGGASNAVAGDHGAGTVITGPSPAQGSASSSAGATPAPTGTTGATTDAVVPSVKPDIITTGSVTLLVSRNSLQHDFDLASAAAAGVGGFVATSSSDLSGTPTPYADLTLRVPSSSLSKVLAEVDGLGKVQQKTLQGQDVTGQVVDLAARIANLESEQVALRQLMGRAGSIPDILQVENQLFSVEQQIEELTAQQDSLAEQVAYSTLTLDMNTVPAPANAKPKPENAALHGVRLAVHNTAAALHGVAIAVGAAFPAIVLVALLFLTTLAWRRRRPAARMPDAPAIE